jgi:hypothetical protein
MSVADKPLEVLVLQQASDEFAALTSTPVAALSTDAVVSAAAVTARFHGFDLEDRPLVAGTPGLPHEILVARSTVPLRQGDIGSTVVLLFDGGDVRQPLIIGVVQDRQQAHEDVQHAAQLVTVQADDDRFVVNAEREITFRCGEASITLTRAGKVIIEGAYIVSQSSGYNKIKGAAVDIN